MGDIQYIHEEYYNRLRRKGIEAGAASEQVRRRFPNIVDPTLVDHDLARYLDEDRLSDIMRLYLTCGMVILGVCTLLGYVFVN